jgi:hypothetical protein
VLRANEDGLFCRWRKSQWGNVTLTDNDCSRRHRGNTARGIPRASDHRAEGAKGYELSFAVRPKSDTFVRLKNSVRKHG